ncbi:MAG TPA: thioredoxin [Candidatus Kapabacteria bacterium]|nr:thioredoxin [Candidatus Kapabacteria bacterium]
MNFLSKQEFLDKVFDYENKQEWEFAGSKPVVIDFYADWCGPCRMLSPIMEELAKEFEGKIDIYKVDTEAEQELAAAFGIKSIPSILFVPINDKPVMAVGALPKQEFVKAFSDIFGISNEVK